VRLDGDDAVDGILAHLEQVGDELRAWEHVSRSTAYLEPVHSGV